MEGKRWNAVKIKGTGDLPRRAGNNCLTAHHCTPWLPDAAIPLGSSESGRHRNVSEKTGD